jgi:hypothetical protein
MRIFKHAWYVLPVVGAMLVSGIGAAEGVSGIPSNAKKVPVTAGGNTQHINATLPGSGAIAGKITVKGSGEPLSSVSVSVIDSKGQFTDGGFTDDNGRYLAGGLDNGKYRVCVLSSSFSKPPAAPLGTVPQCAGTSKVASGFRPPSGAKAVSVSRGSIAHVNLALPKAGAISGSIKSSGGNPVTETTVFVMKGTNTLGSAFSFDGTYEVDGLPAGSGYDVCFGAAQAQGGSSKSGYLSQCWKNSSWAGFGNAPKSSKKVGVRAGKNTKGINAVLHPGGAISGKLVSGSHKPIENAFITVFKGSKAASFGNTAHDGTYTTGGLTTGSYKVCASGGVVGGSSDGFGSRCFKSTAWSGGGKPPAHAKSVSVKIGKVHGHVNFSLPAHKTGSISGKLSGPGGVGLNGASVYVYRGGSQVSGATTASGGTYLVSHLEPGTGYRVCFSTGTAVPESGSRPATGYSDACFKTAKWDNGSVPSSAKAVTVKPGKTTKHVSATVGKGGEISGNVTPAGGTPTFGAEVFVYNAKHDQVGFGFADGTGNYTVTGLTPSSGYIVCFDAGSLNGQPGTPPQNGRGYLNQCWKNKLWKGSSQTSA